MNAIIGYTRMLCNELAVPEQREDRRIALLPTCWR
jgi:hypothetical protein